MNIYQEIWDADQLGNGVKPVLDEKCGDPNQGYIVVNEIKEDEPAHQLFSKVVIPEHKMKTYRLCEKLFNNYTLDKTKRENPTSQEAEEENIFLEAIIDTPPMVVARNWLASRTNQTYSSNRWYQIIKEIWFDRFDKDSGKDLTGFEHVIVGEQRQGVAQGYHFWYKYYLDDSKNLLHGDDIRYNGTRGDNQEDNIQVPEVSTISFWWDAYDYEAKAKRPLFKKIGGFFNGCSIEGLMAIGTVRFFIDGFAPKEAVINNASYNLKLFRGGNGKHMITFYPVFNNIVGDIIKEDCEDTVPETKCVTGCIKIIAALVNPKGHDPGFEKVLLINPTTEDISLNKWLLRDKNNNDFVITEDTLKPSETRWITLPENTAQLSNKGGSIALISNDGVVIHKVLYTKEQASKQGATLLF